MMKAEISLDNGPLKTLAKNFRDPGANYLKVGVLGGYVRRQKGQTSVRRWGTHKHGINPGGPNNAEIGLQHETGSVARGLPERSWLRMPIITRLNAELAKHSQANWERVVVTKGLVGVLHVVGAACFVVIRDAFYTGGFGKWAPLKPATIARKQSSDILIDTTQLERAVTYAVVAPGASTKAIP